MSCRYKTPSCHRSSRGRRDTLRPLIPILILGLASCASPPPPEPQELPETVVTDASLPRLEVNGALLHGEVFGAPESPLIVALHGGPGGDYRSIRSLSALADAYRIVLFDQRGAGLSERFAESEISLDRYVEDVIALIDAYSPDGTAHLIGLSFGGQLAALVAGRYPERIRSAVLLEPGPLNAELAASGPVTGFSWELFALGSEAARGARAIVGPDEHAAEDFRMGYIVYRANPAYACDPTAAPESDVSWRFGSAAFAAISRDLAPPRTGHLDLASPLAASGIPTLFIAGTCNTVIGEAYQRRQMELIPGSEIAVVQDAGHELLRDQPARTLDAISAFLARHR